MMGIPVDVNDLGRKIAEVTQQLQGGSEFERFVYLERGQRDAPDAIEWAIYTLVLQLQPHAFRVCGGCRGFNRIPMEQRSARTFCGACKAPLLVDILEQPAWCIVCERRGERVRACSKCHRPIYCCPDHRGIDLDRHIEDCKAKGAVA